MPITNWMEKCWDFQKGMGTHPIFRDDKAALDEWYRVNNSNFVAGMINADPALQEQARDEIERRRQQKAIAESERAFKAEIARAHMENTLERLEEERLERLRAKAITCDVVLRHACKLSSITKTEILSPQRDKYFVYWRKIAAYVMQKYLSVSLPHIGKRIGGRDHSTICHYLKHIKAELKNPDCATAKDVLALEESLGFIE